MKKKMTSLLALFCMMFCAGASAQSAYQKAYDKAKSKSLVNALSFSLEKDKERLRKAAYKYREDIPKEVLKMAKKDNAILHGTWIQGQTKSWDFFGKPLPIPEELVPLCRYNDSVFAIRNTMMEAQFVQLYNTKKKGLVCILANSLDEIVYLPFLNSVLSNFKAAYGYSNELTTLDGKYSFTKSDNKPLFLCRLPTFAVRIAPKQKAWSMPTIWIGGSIIITRVRCRTTENCIRIMCGCKMPKGIMPWANTVRLCTVSSSLWHSILMV